MRAVIQRVSQAAVSVDQQEIGKIGCGLLVLLGIHETDTPKDVEYLVKKIAQMRIFEDDQGKMNISVEAIPLYESFNEGIRSRGITVATGQFGADMSISLVNDGPVTIIVDSKNK